MTEFLSNDPSLWQLRSPVTAARVFTQNGRFAKQRHTFVVRFHSNFDKNLSNVTFAVKSADRPSVQPHVEELNQYNRKRQVYTGYKTQPVKVSFYDTGDMAAQSMWSAYSKHYFGDFSKTEANFSANEVVGSGALADAANKFGFVLPSSTTADAQYWLSSIEILHVFDTRYDLYTLVHPKITSFDPDDLDYEQSGVAVINASFAYEAVLFSTGAAGSAAQLAEFQSSSGFYTDAVDLPASAPIASYTGYDSSGTAGFLDPSSILSGLFGNAGNGASLFGNFRSFGSPLGGGLGGFGNFVFGAAGGAAGNTIASAFDGAGVTLSSTDLSAVNGNRDGSSQLGFNANIGSLGSSYGYNGPAGVTDPSVAQMSAFDAGGTTAPYAATTDPATTAQAMGQATVNQQAATPQNRNPAVNADVNAMLAGVDARTAQNADDQNNANLNDAAAILNGVDNAQANPSLPGTYTETGGLQTEATSADTAQSAPPPAPPADPAPPAADPTPPTYAPSDPGSPGSTD